MQNRIQIEKISKGSKTFSRAEVLEIYKLEQTCFEQNIIGDIKVWEHVLGGFDLFLAKQDNATVGLIAYKKNADNYHIMTLSVKSDHQHQHIGRMLLQAIIQEAKTENINTTLNCRPANEPFYRKFGFSPVCLPKKTDEHDGPMDYYRVNYYEYGDNPFQSPIRVHGIFMQKAAQAIASEEAKHTEIKWLTPDQNKFERYRIQLLELAVLVKASASCSYGGWLAARLHRSKRKEKALDAVIIELEAFGSEETKIRRLNPVGVLQSIAHNAMMIRGLGYFSSETTSGRVLMNELNTKYHELRTFVQANGQSINYQEFKKFAQLAEGEKSSSTPSPYSPYRHF